MNIEDFLRAQFKSSDFSTHALAGDASSRKYFRVLHKDQSWVLMVWEPYQPESYPFLSVQRHFQKNGVQVPEVVGMSPESGLMLLEDLGDLTLERKFWENQDPLQSFEFYKKTLDELAKIHFKASLDKSACTAFQIEFDTEKLLWELNYGRTHLLEGICQFQQNPKATEELSQTFFKICSRLHQEPKFIAHRDYHSRNVMIKLNKVRVIDFQDARMGPLQYDLVSLIRDSYVQINESMADQLLNHYLSQAKPFLPKTFSREHFDLVFELQTVQRCFKACGSFSSFYMQRKDTRYLKYIAHTLKRVLKSLTFFPEYRNFADALIDSGALEKKYESI